MFIWEFSICRQIKTAKANEAPDLLSSHHDFFRRIRLESEPNRLICSVPKRSIDNDARHEGGGKPSGDSGKTVRLLGGKYEGSIELIYLSGRTNIDFFCGARAIRTNLEVLGSECLPLQPIGSDSKVALWRML